MTASIIMYRVWSSWLVPISWTRKGFLGEWQEVWHKHGKIRGKDGVSASSKVLGR
jgi:hypothetical protein